MARPPLLAGAIAMPPLEVPLLPLPDALGAAWFPIVTLFDFLLL
jgi:hypothetical protein